MARVAGHEFVIQLQSSGPNHQVRKGHKNALFGQKTVEPAGT